MMMPSADGESIRTIRVAFLGFGTVGRALHALIARRREALAREYGIECLVSGVASRRDGWQADRNGLDPTSPAGVRFADIDEWLTLSRPDVVFEAIPLEPHTGQPALDYLRATLRHGAHVVSANKGPVVHGYRELTALALAHHVQYRFESVVMDGAPVFSLVRDSLPLVELRAVRGVFTSTATVVIEAIEQGFSLADGIARAQALGIAEADPAYDIDGWDSAMKLCAVANVLLHGDLRPSNVSRVGLRELAETDIRAALRDGEPLRLVGEVMRDSNGGLTARVAPMGCRPDGSLGTITGATLVMHYESDVFPGGLTVTSRDPDPTTTAYGMFADLVAVVTR
jgi:homoserine dehydrogenase